MKPRKAGESRRPPISPAGAVPPSSTGPLTHWDDVAEWYDHLVGDLGSEYHQQVVLPGLLRLLKPQPGQRILDLGCGQGVLCRLLHERGAEVVGVDAAGNLLALARRRSDPAIAYHLADARDLPALKALQAASFDAVTCVLAIQNMDPLAAVFQSVAWALGPGGRLLLVMMHPAFRGPKATAWGWDERAGVQYRRVDRYLLPRKEPIISHPGRREQRYTWTFHRPLQMYVRALAGAGLLVDVLEEWPSHKTSQPGARAKAENQARREIPLFLALGAVKCSEGPSAKMS